MSIAPDFDAETQAFAAAGKRLQQEIIRRTTQFMTELGAELLAQSSAEVAAACFRAAFIAVTLYAPHTPEEFAQLALTWANGFPETDGDDTLPSELRH